MAKILDEMPPPQVRPSPTVPRLTGEEIQSGAPSVSLSFEQLMELVKAATAGGSKSAEFELATTALKELSSQVKRTVRQSNAEYPGISVFSHPEGELAHPKDRLKYQTYCVGQKQSEEQLTPQEIDLFNAFTSSKEVPSKRWKAELTQNGSATRLSVTFPARTNDDLATLPPLTQILAELLYGSEVADPVLGMQRLAEAEKRIRELQDKLDSLKVMAV